MHPLIMHLKAGNVNL